MGPAHLHVVCGGGTGAQLLSRLHGLGYRITAGPLSDLDDDAQTAATLGLEVVLTPPVGVPRAGALDRVRELLAEADGVVLTPFAVGKGNLENLTLATELPLGKPLYLVVGGEFARRDHTGGEASRLYGQLRARATALPGSLHELLPLLLDRFPLG